MNRTEPRRVAVILAFGGLCVACSGSGTPAENAIDDAATMPEASQTGTSADRPDAAGGDSAAPPEGGAPMADGDSDGEIAVLDAGASPDFGPEAGETEDAGSIPEPVDVGGGTACSDAGSEDTAAYILTADAAAEAEAGGRADAGRGDGGDAGDGGDGGDAGDGGNGAIPECKPSSCGTHSWACWPMPNSPSSGLPNAANYTDMGDGTVRDNRTCLIWEKGITSSSSFYTYEKAQERCANPAYPGTGWHVPTRIELMSITDYGRISPSADIVAFTPGVPYDNFWTLSPVSGTSTAWTIRFYEGMFQMQNQQKQFYARCVRGNGNANLPNTPPPSHYSSPAYGEVLDNYTKLLWQEKDSQAPMAFESAIKYCNTLSLNGDHWRLASIKELATLVNDAAPINQTAPVVEMSTFGTMAAASYWSSSLYDGQRDAGAFPWTLNFLDGSISSSQGTAYAKCVQDTR